MRLDERSFYGRLITALHDQGAITSQQMRRLMEHGEQMELFRTDQASAFLQEIGYTLAVNLSELPGSLEAWTRFDRQVRSAIRTAISTAPKAYMEVPRAFMRLDPRRSILMREFIEGYRYEINEMERRLMGGEVMDVTILGLRDSGMTPWYLGQDRAIAMRYIYINRPELLLTREERRLARQWRDEIETDSRQFEALGMARAGETPRVPSMPQLIVWERDPERTAETIRRAYRFIVYNAIEHSSSLRHRADHEYLNRMITSTMPEEILRHNLMKTERVMERIAEHIRVEGGSVVIDQQAIRRVMESYGMYYIPYSMRNQYDALVNFVNDIQSSREVEGRRRARQVM